LIHVSIKLLPDSVMSSGVNSSHHINLNITAGKAEESTEYPTVNFYLPDPWSTSSSSSDSVVESSPRIHFHLPNPGSHTGSSAPSSIISVRVGNAAVTSSSTSPLGCNLTTVLYPSNIGGTTLSSINCTVLTYNSAEDTDSNSTFPLNRIRPSRRIVVMDTDYGNVANPAAVGGNDESTVTEWENDDGSFVGDADLSEEELADEVEGEVVDATLPSTQMVNVDEVDLNDMAKLLIDDENDDSLTTEEKEFSYVINCKYEEVYQKQKGSRATFLQHC
jgi:hypothetical protein